MSTVTYKSGRFKRIWERTLSTREPVILKSKGRGDVAVLPADELSALLETAHLLRSPKNARRLLESLRNANAGKYAVTTLEKLRRQLGMDGTRN
ncbi:MAG: type II toxin-antitoxin system Phd/YefM family antitoxin [Verrucomicrobiota bacterium]|nr:type II toxin-antitoxin system Phd/YefM family antitoxin [Verrucomicrobiota bacterium]